MLKNIKDNWQILTVICLLWSFFDIAFFYQGFGIDIQEYISTSEIILLTLPSILKGLLILGSVLFLSSLSHSSGKGSIYQDQSKMWRFRFLYRSIVQHIKSKRPLGVLISAIEFVMNIAGAIFSISVLFVTFYLIFYTHTIYKFVDSNHTWPVVFMCFFFGVLPFLMIFSDYAERPGRIVLKKILFNNDPIFYFVISFILCSVISTEVNHSIIKHGMGLKRVSLIRAGKKMETDSSLVYIGSTQNFIFLWDKRYTHSLILNRNAVDSVLLSDFSDLGYFRK